MKYQYNDGGRAAAGFKGTTRDCGCRAFAIATGFDYEKVYQELSDINIHKNKVLVWKNGEYVRKTRRKKKTARHGISRKALRQLCVKYGWEYIDMPIYSATINDLPKGTVIAEQDRHIVTVIDNIAQDTWDSTKKVVFGYWRKKV